MPLSMPETQNFAIDSAIQNFTVVQIAGVGESVSETFWYDLPSLLSGNRDGSGRVFICGSLSGAQALLKYSIGGILNNEPSWFQIANPKAVRLTTLQIVTRSTGVRLGVVAGDVEAASDAYLLTIANPHATPSATEQATPITQAGHNIQSVAYSPIHDRWLAVASNGEVISGTGDGVTWTLRASLGLPGPTGLPATVRWVNDRFIIVRENASSKPESIVTFDGINNYVTREMSINGVIPTAYPGKACLFGASLFVPINANTDTPNGGLLTRDGVSWKSSVTFGGGRLKRGCAFNGRRIMTVAESIGNDGPLYWLSKGGLDQIPVVGNKVIAATGEAVSASLLTGQFCIGVNRNIIISERYGIV